MVLDLILNILNQIRDKIGADAQSWSHGGMFRVPMGCYLAVRKYNQRKIVVNLYKCVMHDSSISPVIRL